MFQAFDESASGVFRLQSVKKVGPANMANTSFTSVGNCADSWSREPRPLIDTRTGPHYTRTMAGLVETSPAGFTRLLPHDVSSRGGPTMDHLQQRLEALEQRTCTVARQLRWWRGLACALVGLGVLTWALPSGTAQGTLEQRGAALEAKLVRLTFEAATNTLVLTGANLQIVNGLSRTDCVDEEGEPMPNCPNGLGNLIMGYNELRRESEGPNIRTGSHNVVVGMEQNFSRYGGLVVGRHNEISGDFAAVSGGAGNTASGSFAAVSGGEQNTASGFSAAVSGGSTRAAPGAFDWVASGLFQGQ
jgi:hypothetical protein